MLDCNGNSIPDGCDIAAGTSADIDHNGVSDSCKLDCDNDGLPDPYETASGFELDCNHNTVPDSCECLADLSEGGRGDGADFAIALAFRCNPNVLPRAKLSQDGTINGTDIGEILSNWSECP